MGQSGVARELDNSRGSTLDVVIVDDHPAVVSGVGEWLSAADPPIRLLDAEGRLAPLYVGPSRYADVVILDLHLRSEHPAHRELARLAEEGRRVIVYSQRADRDTALRCLEIGAATYLTKAEGKNHLIPAVQAVAADLPYASPTLAGVLAADSGRAKLSLREKEVLRAWFECDSKALVANRLYLSVKSVETYINRVRIKYAMLGRAAPTKAALVARALQDGLIELDEL